MKLIVYLNPETGGVEVIEPDLRARRTPGEDFLEADWLKRIIARRVPPHAVGVQIVDHTELPTKRFRNAWVRRSGKVTVDLARAKELVRAEMPLRTSATTTKLARVADAIEQAQTVEELEEAVNRLGWRTAVVSPNHRWAMLTSTQPPEEGEDF